MKRIQMELICAVLIAAAAFLVGRNHPSDGGQLLSKPQDAPTKQGGLPTLYNGSASRTETSTNNGTPAPAPVIDVPSRPDPLGMAILSRPTLLDRDGLLSPAAVRELKLQPEEELLVKQKLSEFHSKMESLAKNNLSKDATRSNPQTGVTAYRIQSFAAEGKSALRDLQKTLGAALGEGRAASLVSMYPSGNMYGSLGVNDVVVVFQAETTQPDGAKIIPCSVEEYDPHSGKKIVSRSGQFESVSAMFGNIFTAQEIE